MAKRVRKKDTSDTKIGDSTLVTLAKMFDAIHKRLDALEARASQAEEGAQALKVRTETLERRLPGTDRRQRSRRW